MTAHLAAKPAGTHTWIDVASPPTLLRRALPGGVWWEYDIGPADMAAIPRRALVPAPVAGVAGVRQNPRHLPEIVLCDARY
ncbi:MAG: hypothetical protein U0074_08585 [Kouleothrix sp.]